MALAETPESGERCNNINKELRQIGILSYRNTNQSEINIKTIDIKFIS
jgi:hypothetical protein